MTDTLKYYTEPSFLNKPENIFYGFFTRLGGISQTPYQGLNCGQGSEDKPKDIEQNRAIVANQCGVNPNSLLSLHQHHSAQVLRVDTPWETRPKADGFVTDKPNIALGILTADCAPALFYGEKENGDPVIGAAHAGWKGALSGVLCNTVLAMHNLGAQKETIQACIGPCIGKNSYEVSLDFIKPFLAENEGSEIFFHSAAREGHIMFDLSGYCAWRLFRAGLRNVALLDKDTYTNADEFYSYRRMCHENEGDYGRQISVISIK